MVGVVMFMVMIAVVFMMSVIMLMAVIATVIVAMFMVMMIAAMVVAVFILMVMIAIMLMMIMFMVRIAVVIMDVFMLTMMIFTVIVAIFTLMLALIMRHVIRLPVQQHHGVNAVNAAPLIAAELQLPAGKSQLAKFSAQGIGVYPQINQGPQGHIAGDSGKTIKMQCFHQSASHTILLQRFIHAAHNIAFQFKGHIEKAESF